MRLARLLATVMGSLIAALGAVGIAAPSALLELGRSMQTPSSLYAVAAVRVTFGAVLIWVASVSRVPRTLRVIGAIIIAAALLTPLFGVESAQAMLGWFSNRGPLFMRAWACIPVAFGAFIVWAVNS